MLENIEQVLEIKHSLLDMLESCIRKQHIYCKFHSKCSNCQYHLGKKCTIEIQKIKILDAFKELFKT